MFAILIPAAWTIAFLALLGAGRTAREAALIAFTTVTAAVVVLTETLSAFNAITPAWVAASWAVTCLLSAVVLRQRMRAGLARLRDAKRVRWDTWETCVAAGLGLLACGALAAALLYPTTNNDSLAYHMPRVFFWFQNHSVAYYPTADARQLFSSPLVEYFVLNLKALALGSDRMAGLVQWLSYVFAIIAVSLLAQRLGASRRGQQAAALAAASVPMAALQASTTQTDLTCALWCLVAAYCLVRLAGRPRRSARTALLWASWAGVSGALAVWAKPPAYLILVPFAGWAVGSLVRRRGFTRAALLAGVALLCFAVLSAPWYVRNAKALDGDFLALSAPDNKTLVQVSGVGNFATTFLRNSSMLLGTPFNHINRPIVGTVKAIVQSYGGDIDEPLTKLYPEMPFALPVELTLHDNAPAPLTMALIALSAVIALLGTKRQADQVAAYTACAAVGLVLCAGLISWNPWITRILVAPVLMLTPIVGIALSSVQAPSGRGLKFALAGMLGLSVAAGLFATVFDMTNPLAPPIRQESAWANAGFWNTSYDNLRFKMNPDCEAPFKAVAAAAQTHGIQRIGIDQHFKNFNIYTMLSLLPDVRWGYVGGTKLPELLDPNAFSPQAILELVPTDQYPAVLGDGAPRGTELLPPQRTSDAVILFYQVP